MSEDEAQVEVRAPLVETVVGGVLCLLTGVLGLALGTLYQLVWPVYMQVFEDLNVELPMMVIGAFTWPLRLIIGVTMVVATGAVFVTGFASSWAMARWTRRLATAFMALVAGWAVFVMVLPKTVLSQVGSPLAEEELISPATLHDLRVLGVEVERAVRASLRTTVRRFKADDGVTRRFVVYRGPGLSEDRPALVYDKIHGDRGFWVLPAGPSNNADEKLEAVYAFPKPAKLDLSPAKLAGNLSKLKADPKSWRDEDLIMVNEFLGYRVTVQRARLDTRKPDGLTTADPFSDRLFRVHIYLYNRGTKGAMLPGSGWEMLVRVGS